MTDALPHPAPDLPAPLGPRIRHLRREAGLSLAELAARTDVSEATLSRIETGKSEVSAPHLYRLAAALGRDVGSFFDAAPVHMAPGRRSVTRRAEGAPLDTPRLHGRALATELMHKQMHPFVNHVRATTLDAAGGLQSHAGEEFLFVLSGQLILLSDTYAPLHLHPGDSLYFDGAQPHAYLSADPEGVEFLVVNSDQMSDMFKGAPQ